MPQDCENKSVRSSEPTILHLFKAAECVGGLEPKELAGKSASRNVAVVRHAVMWIAHKHLGMSASAIGRFLNRDHTTVIYGIQKVQERVDYRSGKTTRLIESIRDTMKTIADGGTVTPVKKFVPPVKPQFQDDPARPLKHWRFYPVCSDEWWRSNDLSFREGMKKARASVLTAGE